MYKFLNINSDQDPDGGKLPTECSENENQGTYILMVSIHSKFGKNPLITFWIILITTRQTERHWYKNIPSFNLGGVT